MIDDFERRTIEGLMEHKTLLNQILEQTKKTNGTVSDHSVALAKLVQWREQHEQECVRDREDMDEIAHTVRGHDRFIAGHPAPKKKRFILFGGGLAAAITAGKALLHFWGKG